MSWSSIANKKTEIKIKKTKEKKLPTKKKITIIDEENCIEIFERKYDIDLFDFCFELKDNMNKSNDLLSNIDSFKIENFIKEHIDYRPYENIPVESSEDKDS